MQSIRTLIVVALAGLSTAVLAQDFPVRPIRFVVPQTAGGASDALARITGQKLGDQWGQQIIIDNRGGAGGNIGTDIVSKSAPDGYTWLLAYVVPTRSTRPSTGICRSTRKRTSCRSPRSRRCLSSSSSTTTCR
jgi:tripartite-type tricarboxylate transporter receptor subunit TctC